MGRPEPCVLFAQTFSHPHLDEYVDEVLFTEPVVITACEFLEQNASSACPAVKLMGATSPPSFALEVFVLCEGETRYRRLCQPYLYSHSSSNVLDVEALVTNHLVVRGSYRSLSMVLYGNTAEDLGQFNIEVDMDSSLPDTVATVEGNLEDLPPVFHPTKLTIEDLASPLNILKQQVFVAREISLEMKKFLQLVFKVLDSRKLEADASKVLSSLLSVASTYATPLSFDKRTGQKQSGTCRAEGRDAHLVLIEAGKELADILRSLQNQSGDPCSEFSAETLFLESETSIPSSKELVDTLSQKFDFCSNAESVGYPELSKNKNMILWLNAALLLCSAKESCFHFVNYGGMKQLAYAFTHRAQNSAAFTLLLLGVIEQATRHSIGCEGFLGWWPREDESIPSGISDGYNELLKLLMENQRHDIASFAIYILHRIRFYEVTCRYECAVLSIFGNFSAVEQATKFTLDKLASVKVQLQKLLKLINLSGPVEDPSPVAAASRCLLLDDAGLLAYKATSGLINLSSCCFSVNDIDSHLLSLLKERGFLPLSVALLSSSVLQSDTGHTLDLLVDIVSQIEATILTLLLHRSGLSFLLHDPEVSRMVIHSLHGAENIKKQDSISLRYAITLISKGFFCRPEEVGMIIEMNVRALNAIDRLVTLAPNTEEFLWVLWDLCRLSRSECGRQALLVLVNFPEAISVLMVALHSGRELDPISLNTGASPLDLAIFHSAAEIFEVIVADSTATSMVSWINHAKELHRALHSSSPGSNQKDAPARLLEWIDAGVVYHRNGAIGLLRYAAVLASGGDAHMAANSVLASDMMDVDNLVGDLSSSDGNGVDNLLGKRITEKDFPGVILRDSVVAQLTTAFRILSFISDNPAVAAALYDEGAVMVVHAVVINCRLMLERSSNIYDYLVDESTEFNSTSDLLLERNREKSVVDLLIPSLVLLINLLQKLQEAGEQHRNTKLMNALLQLHREVSPKLAACAADLSCSCPDFALGFEAVCHLLASALACWPVYGWLPGLFHFLLDSLHATTVLALGPKEICSLFCLLNDLFPDERTWLWKNGMPILSTLRALAVGTILGPKKEKEINWYLMPGHPEKLVGQLSLHLGKLAEIILHCASSMSIVIQDILRIFIVRIACLNVSNASLLLRHIILWVSHRLSDPAELSDVESCKVYALLNFIGLLLEYPNAKSLLLREGGFQMLIKALERYMGITNFDVKHFGVDGNLTPEICIPVFNSISLICGRGASLQHSGRQEQNISIDLTAEQQSTFLSHLLKFCTVLPVGKELLACLSALKEMSSSTEGKHALMSIFEQFRSPSTEVRDSQVRRDRDGRSNINDASDWNEHPPLLSCWNNLLNSISSKGISPPTTAAAIHALSFGALSFCMDVERMNPEMVTAIKFFFGVKDDSSLDGFVAESMKHIEELATLLGSETSNGLHAFPIPPSISQVKETASSLMLLLQTSPDTVEDGLVANVCESLTRPAPSRIHRIFDRSMERIEDFNLSEFGDKFVWECPENLRDRLTQTGLPAKRKISSLEVSNRRARGDNMIPEAVGHSTFSKGAIPVPSPSGVTRRDTFRQRKPNTSRPPSMHVDDYVARERNADGTNNSNVIAVPRIGPTSGRPPSIHVDEFMARQKERHTVVAMTSAEVKTTAPSKDGATETSSRNQPSKPDLDDDLQGIDIVFDAEESEPDDKLPFPQPDDTLQQPASVIVEQRSPHSIVEETESDVNESSQFSHLGAPIASNMDENTASEFSSRMSASRMDMQLTREPSISSDKKFPYPSEDSKNFQMKAPGAFASDISLKMPSSSGQVPFGSRMMPHNLYSKASPQQGGTVLTSSPGLYDQKFPLNQPPLPPMPPPPTISPVMSQNMDPSVQSEYVSATAGKSTALAASSPSPDPKFGRAPLSSPGGATRPPPIPPTPPYPANPSYKNPTSQSPMYIQTTSSNSNLQQTSFPLMDVGTSNFSASRIMLTSYPPNSLVQPMLFRPASVPVGPYGENLPSISQNLPIALPSVNPVPPFTQLQPLQPPQIPRPPQHLRPSIAASPHSEHGVSFMQNPLQVPGQSSQMLQQSQVSPAQSYFQTQQQDNTSQSLPQQQIAQSIRLLQSAGDGTSQQQDSGTSLQDYFRSPEAIQSLLSDRDKLCQLLEQHPKLMQMLQEQLGHL